MQLEHGKSGFFFRQITISRRTLNRRHVIRIDIKLLQGFLQHKVVIKRNYYIASP